MQLRHASPVARVSSWHIPRSVSRPTQSPLTARSASFCKAGSLDSRLLQPCSKQPRRLQRWQRRRRWAPPVAASAAGATAAACAAYGGASHAAHVLAAKLGASAAQIGAYLPFLPAAITALQSVPLPSLDMAGARTMRLATAPDIRFTLT